MKREGKRNKRGERKERGGEEGGEEERREEERREGRKKGERRRGGGEEEREGNALNLLVLSCDSHVTYQRWLQWYSRSLHHRT